MNAPKLKCRDAGELRRIVDWLAMSRIPCTFTQSELTISLGADGFIESPGWSCTPLSFLQASTKMFWALKRLVEAQKIELGDKQEAKIALAVARGDL